MSRKITITVGALAIAAALVVAFEFGRRQSWATSQTGAEGSTGTPAGAERNSSSAGTAAPSPSGGGVSPALEPYVPLEGDPSHPAIQFVSPEGGDGVPAMVIAGAPGIWPPEPLTTDRRGVLYLPKTDVETLRGAELPRFELLARSPRGSLAYWDVVRFENEEGSSDGDEPREVQLEAGATVEVTVRGPNGSRRSGANVRLSRGALGFVTLNKHSGPDGRASFRAIPAGEYVASAQLPEVGRGRARLVHASDAVSEVEIALTAPAELEPRHVEEEGPREIEVRLHGLKPAEWRRANLRWRTGTGEWRLATLQPADEPSARRWRKRVRSPSVHLEVKARSGTYSRRAFRLAPGKNEFTWRVDMSRRVDVYVVDPYGVPVEGALVRAWRGDRKIASRRSRGSEPVAIGLGVDSTVDLIALDARRGEAHRSIEPSRTERVTLRLDDPLFSTDHPSGRVRDRSRIRQILEVPILRDGESWRIDGTDPASRAIRAGLQRGDRLVTIRRRGGGWSVLFQRDGRIDEVLLAGE